MSASPDARPYTALAAECLAALRGGDPIWRPAAEALASAAVSSDAGRAAEASHALFRGVVEPLADSFRAADARANFAFFAHVLQVARRLPGGEALDAALRRHGLADERAIAERAERLSALPRQVDPQRVRRAAVLSRVTIGADIAVTSVFLRAALELFPRAGIVFVGGERNAALFAGEPRVERVEAPYRRGGALRERLAAWLKAERLLAEAAAGFAPGDFLLLDPDSRIGQLGLLPFLPADKGYLHFDSRSYGDGQAAPIGALAADWLAERLGGPSPSPRPWLALASEATEAARRFVAPLRRPLAAVNFGFGGNEAKRVGRDFELAACRRLLQAGYALALDRGAGGEEAASCDDLAARLRAEGAADDRLAVFEGPFDRFAALIGQSDLFVGYDSAGAHAAAALGVRAIDVFAGATSPIMLSRWSPWGARPADVLAVAPGESPDSVARRFGERLA